MQQSDAHQQLREAPLFQRVDPMLISTWLNYRPVRELQAGDCLLHCNTPNDKIFLLLEGELVVHLQRAITPSIATIRAGEIVGEVSSLEHGKATAFVSASTTCSLCIVRQDELMDWAQQSHDFAVNLITMLSKRLGNSNVKLRQEQNTGRLLQARSVTDALTGLLNRGWLSDTQAGLQRLLSHAEGNIGVLMIDVDHFKRINDTYGHPAGDQVLCDVAKTLRRLTRRQDVLLRWGGEEFLLLTATDVDGHALRQLAERIRLGVSETPIEALDQERITVSIGVAFSNTDENWEQVVARADAAMYTAKREGRNRVVTATPP